MRILVLGINYVPEKTGIAPFTSGLCEHLASQGHTVRVVTGFPYYPGWKVFGEYRGACYRREIINGVAVHRLWHFVPWRPSRLWQRLFHDLSFAASAFLGGLLAGKCDLIYCCCPPPTLGIAAYLLSKIKRSPFVIKLADLASDAALATGIMSDGPALRVARRLERFVYGRAKSVVCLCQGFVEHLSVREVPREKLRLIPDWGDTEGIGALADCGHFRAEHAIFPDQFLILHTGNMGKKQDLKNAVKTAQLLGEGTAIRWLLVGDGEERALLEREAAERAPRTVRLLPLQPAELLASMYAAADLLLLNQKSTVKDSVIPSKLLTYMAAGRPIVAAVSPRSEAARHIQGAGCGLVIPSEAPEALAEAVLFLSREPELRRTMGTAGRAYAEAHFTKRRVLEQYDLFFRHLIPDTTSSLPAQQMSGKGADTDCRNTVQGMR